MFDPLFEDELQNLILMAQLPPPQQQPAIIVNRSAFSPFVKESTSFRKTGSVSSMNKRMIELSRKVWSRKIEMREPEKQRSLKHVKNERLRRERERQSFLDLHAILPPGVRNEKITIVQTAAAEIQNLERLKEELQRKNTRMVERVGRDDEGERRAKIRVRVNNPTSGIDSLQEVLKCLKHMGLSPNRIGFELSNQELVALVEFDNEIEVAEVEAVIQTTLAEVDKWLANDPNLYNR